MARYLLLSKEIANAKNNTPYLRCKLQDKMGQITGIIFNYTSLPSNLIESIEQGKVVDVVGDLSEYNGTTNLKITSIALSEDQNMHDLFPTTDFDKKLLEKEFISLMREVTDVKYQEFLKYLLKDKDTLALYTNKPAAKMYHHAHNAGLLEHSVGVTKSALALSKIYNGLDTSLLVTGALFHDIGKCWEQGDESTGMEYTDDGKLLGHIILGIQYIQKIGSILGDDYKEQTRLLSHIIAAHHGECAMGSPVEPVCAEAFVIHQSDYIDAYMKVAFETLKSDEMWAFKKPYTPMIRNHLLKHVESSAETYYSIGGVSNE